MNKKEVIDILNFRHSCREFDTNKKISNDDFKIILEGGRLSPSSLGIEPWKFLVIENQELKNELGEVSWGGKTQMPTCSHLVVVLSRNAVYSGDNGKFSMEREKALNALNKEEIQVIFSVDMFNEGLDIPGIDMVIFLRPTQSPTVFLQQLGSHRIKII